jgi:acylphosphatase
MSGRRFVVRGRVQGVGFRYFVLSRARLLGLQGWVRNLPDGTVEARAWGEDGALQSLRAHLAEGPGHARVETVEVSPLVEGSPGEVFEIID